MKHRVLEVLSGVAEHGPITLDGLCERIPRSRSAIYRALKTLHDDGWIRRWLNGRDYVVTSKLDELLAFAEIGTSEIERFVLKSKKIDLASKFVVRVSIQYEKDTLQLVDSSEYDPSLSARNPTIEAIEHNLVAATTLSQMGIRRHRCYDAWSERDEKRCWETLQSDGYFFDEISSSGYVVGFSKNVQLIVIEVAPKGPFLAQEQIHKTTQNVRDLARSEQILVDTPRQNVA